MGQFTLNGVTYEELPGGKVRVVGYEGSQQNSVVPPDPAQVQQRGFENAIRGNSDSRDDTRLGLSIEGENRANRGEQRDNTKTNFDFAKDLRGQFQALPAVKEYQTVVRQLSTALTTKNTPTGDQALITAYAKMLDPGSVVREQEFNVVAAGDSTLGKSVARLQKELGIDGGGMLRPEVRQRVREEMLNLARGYNKSYNQVRAEYRDIADGYGVDPQNVIGSHLAEPYADSVREWGKRNGKDRDNSPAAVGLANPGASSKSIPIPPQMQAEFQQGLGRVQSADDYAALRDSLDRKYGFGPAAPAKAQEYRAEWPNVQRAVAQGRTNLSIPPVNAAMTGRDNLNASVFNNPVGAALAAAPVGASFVDEAAGGIRSVLNGTDYNVERDVANATRQQLQTQYPGSSIAGALGGGMIGGGAVAKYAPKLADITSRTLPRMIGTGAALGGVSGAGEYNDDRATGAFYGAVAGGGGAALGRAVAPALDRISTSRPVQAIAQAGNAAANLVRRTPVPFQQAPRLSRMDEAVSAVPIDGIRQNVTDAQGFGLPYTLADATPQTRALAGAASRFSPRVRSMAEDSLTSRQDERSERAMRMVREVMGEPVDLAGRKDYWTQAAKQQASPLYDEAFQGGSVAPLENQLSDAFNQSSQAVAEAKRLLAETQRNATLSSAAVQRSGNNVYQNAKALPQNREASAAIAAAEKRVAEAEAQHSQVLGQLRQSQGDAANNAPGAVWNPRLQQFIDDPLSKIGLRKGLEVQRLEALARNERFDPTEYAITGNDAQGNPVVGKVPNMRTLDAIKRGYDEILNGYPVDVRGKPVFDERGRAITMAKQALVEELDSINPTYAFARDSYGTYAKNREALDWGYNAPSRNVIPRDMQAQMQSMSPSQINEARSAYSTRVTDDIAKSERGNPLELFYGTPGSTTSQRRAKVGTLFPDAVPKLDRISSLERDMANTYQEVLGGSATQPRRIADEQFAGRGGEIATNAAIDMATGSPGIATGMGAARGLLRNLSDQRSLGGFGAQAKADEIGPGLLGSDPNAVLKYLDELDARQREVALRRGQFNRVGGLLGAFAVPGVTGAASGY